MTDNEIIKALEKALSDVDAPIGEHWGSGFLSTENIRQTLDLINRQKTEIERLKGPNRAYPFCNLLEGCLVFSKNLKDYNDMRKGLKSEGRKEFAERLKKKTYPFPCAIGVENAVTIRGINDLLAEMESERK